MSLDQLMAPVVPVDERALRRRGSERPHPSEAFAHAKLSLQCAAADAAADAADAAAEAEAEAEASAAAAAAAAAAALMRAIRAM